MLKDTEAREVFDSVVKIQVGNGLLVLFWYGRWLEGSVKHRVWETTQRPKMGVAISYIWMYQEI
jgi:hypothetical protein